VNGSALDGREIYLQSGNIVRRRNQEPRECKTGGYVLVSSGECKKFIIARAKAHILVTFTLRCD
jgi:hypothetical protein